MAVAATRATIVTMKTNVLETAAPHRRRFHPASEVRVYRLRAGVLLADAARHAGLTLVRAGEVERDPTGARVDELDRLKALSA